MGWMGAAMGWMGALEMHEAFNACYAGARGASRALRRAHAFLSLHERKVRTARTNTDLYLRKGTDSWQNNFSVIVGLHATRFAESLSTAWFAARVQKSVRCGSASSVCVTRVCETCVSRLPRCLPMYPTLRTSGFSQMNTITHTHQ